MEILNSQTNAITAPNDQALISEKARIRFRPGLATSGLLWMLIGA